MKEKQLSYERYHRQLILSGFGEEGQQKLVNSRVLVVGAGGLGCPALQYLVAAGVGTVGLVDDDIVSLHNLHRQVLFTNTDIGLLKANVATARLSAMNPEVLVRSFPIRLTSQNALAILNAYDYVLDATDNFATRYLINDAAVLLHKPLVYGAISRFEGQVAVFNAGENSVNYRDLFPEPPPPGSILNCAEAGVLGVLPGIIGTMQASEMIKLITGIGQPLINRLFTYNALTNDSFVFDLTPKKATAARLPNTPQEFEAINYDWLCGNPESGKTEEIEPSQLPSFLSKADTAIIDVREKGELPAVTSFPHRKMPLSTFRESSTGIKENTVVLFCQSGKRSREAAGILSATFGASKKIYSLRGGILNWMNHGEKKA